MTSPPVHATARRPAPPLARRASSRGRGGHPHRPTHPVMPPSGTLTCALPGLSVAQGDLVGLGDMAGLDGPQSLAQALASLPQQLKGVGGGALRGGALRISPVFLDEVGLQGRGDFVGRLQRVVDGPVPCGVVNHAASIARLRAAPVRGRRWRPDRPFCRAGQAGARARERWSGSWRIRQATRQLTRPGTRNPAVTGGRTALAAACTRRIPHGSCVIRGAFTGGRVLRGTLPRACRSSARSSLPAFPLRGLERDLTCMLCRCERVPDRSGNGLHGTAVPPAGLGEAVPRPPL